MQELTARSIRAVQIFVEALALLCFVVSRLVLLLLELVGTVGERAGVRVLTYTVELPELTNLRLELHLEAQLAHSGFLRQSSASLPQFD